MSLVIFVEERSMREALTALLPKLDVDPSAVTIIAFQGAPDLERSLPDRLRAWRDPRARFLVLRDNDNGDCRQRKERLLKIAEDAGRLPATKVRIVCQELEAWFLGDPSAIDAAGLGKRVATDANRRRWRDPDGVRKPSEELRNRLGHYPKIDGARQIAEHLSIAENASTSFRQTVQAIRDLAG